MSEHGNVYEWVVRSVETNGELIELLNHLQREGYEVFEVMTYRNIYYTVVARMLTGINIRNVKP